MGRTAERSIGAQHEIRYRTGTGHIPHVGDILRLGLRGGASVPECLARLIRGQCIEWRTTRRAHHGEQGFGIGIERHVSSSGAPTSRPVGRAISVGAAGSASEPTLKNPCPRIHD